MGHARNHPPTAVRAALYLRQSLDTKSDGLAVDRQREACEAIARDRGWTVIDEYPDNSISASDKRKERKHYDRLVRDYAAGAFDALLCWDLDRLTRQPRQLEDWIDAAENRGLRLVTANGEADLTTDGGRLFARMKVAVARAEIERKAARQKAAAAQRAEHGRPPLGTRLTGYATDGAVIEDEAAVVREVFARFAAGDSLKSLARWLTDQGVPTRRKLREDEKRRKACEEAERAGASFDEEETDEDASREDRWNPSTVATILRNPRYAGRAIYCGRPTGKPGKWASLVSDEVFADVQARLDDPRRVTNRHGTDRRYLGGGLFLCGRCDGPVSTWSGRRYRCRRACYARSAEPVDAYVLRLVRERLARPDLADLIAPDNSAEVGELRAEVARLRERLKQTENDYDADLIDGRRYHTKREKINAELAQCEARRARLRRGRGGALAAVLSADDPVATFNDASLMFQRSVVDDLVVVRLLPVPQGRRGFDPATVSTMWKI